MANKWFVSRQCYFGADPEEQNIVEIAKGGCDYANPDMLVGKYEGEGEEYSDPREAVTVALEIANQWKKDCPNLIIGIGHGCTCGMTMPFEADEPEDLKKWAEETWEKLEKCDWCGEVLPEEHFTLPFTDDKYCSEYCAEKANEQIEVEDI